MQTLLFFIALDHANFDFLCMHESIRNNEENSMKNIISIRLKHRFFLPCKLKRYQAAIAAVFLSVGQANVIADANVSTPANTRNAVTNLTVFECGRAETPDRSFWSLESMLMLNIH